MSVYISVDANVYKLQGSIKVSMCLNGNKLLCICWTEGKVLLKRGNGNGNGNASSSNIGRNRIVRGCGGGDGAVSGAGRDARAACLGGCSAATTSTHCTTNTYSQLYYMCVYGD